MKKQTIPQETNKNTRRHEYTYRANGGYVVIIKLTNICLQTNA